MAFRLARFVCAPFLSTCARPSFAVTAASSRISSSFLPTSLAKSAANSPLNHHIRTMASAPTKTEWLVVVPDAPGKGAKRLEVRPTHFAGLSAPKESGQLLFGGAILEDLPSDPNDPKTFDFAGSTLIVQADTRDEVVAFLNNDVYSKEGVWDVNKAQIWPLKTAFRQPLNV